MKKVFWKTVLNGMKLGGVNLLPDSRLDALRGWTVNGGSSSVSFGNFYGFNCTKITAYGSGVYTSIESTQGESYVFSVDVYTEGEGSFLIGFNKKSIVLPVTGGGWRRLSAIIDVAPANTTVVFYSRSNTAIYIKNARMGRYPDSFDWFPNPGEIGLNP